MRSFLNKFLKFVLICLAVYILLVGLSWVMNAMNRLMDKESRVALHDIWFLKYALFGLVGYLVLTERI